MQDKRFNGSKSIEDLDRAECTVEEREEYEPHLALGNVVHTGIDYGRILERIERESDIILWDGGNNDFAFYRPDINVVLIDPMRAGHETNYHPGEAVLRMADVVVVAKMNSASAADVITVTESARQLAPLATIVRGASKVTLDDAAKIKGKRVLVIEDGPTITHGGMAYGAGFAAAQKADAAEIIDPRAAARGRIAAVFAEYPHIGNVVPAMGYSERELADLKETIKAAGVDAVVSGTPCDLSRLIKTRMPIVRARYEFEDVDGPSLSDVIMNLLRDQGLWRRMGRHAPFERIG